MLKVIGCFFNTDLPPILLPTSTFLNSKCFILTVSCLLFVFQDTVIYDRLAETSKYKEITLKHLEQFATEGERNAATKCDYGRKGVIPASSLAGLLLSYLETPKVR